MRFKWILLVAALLMTLLPAVGAQDGLSEEEQALLERVTTALQGVETYTSFETTVTLTETQTIDVALLGQQSNQVSSSVVQLDAVVIDSNGDNPNVSGTAVATVSEAEDNLTTDYVLEAEFRFVEGVLYVNAQYADGTTGPLPLPEGWVTVDDVEAPEFEVLNLDEVVGDMMNLDEANENDNLLDALGKVAEAATSVTLTEEEIDGTAVEVVTITFNWTGIRDVLAADNPPDASNPFFAIIEQIEGDIASISLVLDENDQVIGYRFNLSMTVAEVDLSQFTDEVPAGTMISIDFTQAQDAALSNINGTFEPVTAPE
ncbi:MAG: hypothetical protein K8I82_29670 [Anaerolineae bacterium]|nr:hypothetical protein [Anaerolineae bacterium]